MLRIFLKISLCELGPMTMFACFAMTSLLCLGSQVLASQALVVLVMTDPRFSVSMFWFQADRLTKRFDIVPMSSSSLFCVCCVFVLKELDHESILHYEEDSSLYSGLSFHIFFFFPFFLRKKTPVCPFVSIFCFNTFYLIQ